MHTFLQPTLIAFMGIPGSGKSTLAKTLALSFQNTDLYLETEEVNYPTEIKEKFKQNDLLCLYNYFRSQRIPSLLSATQKKIDGRSAIIDSYFDKLMYPMLKRKRIDSLISSKHPAYPEILDIALHDAETLPQADVLIFLNVSDNLHLQFLKARHRNDSDWRNFGEHAIKNCAAFCLHCAQP